MITHIGFVMAPRALSIAVGEPPFKGNLKRKLKISRSVGKRGLGLSRCGCCGLGWSGAEEGPFPRAVLWGLGRAEFEIF